MWKSSTIVCVDESRVGLAVRALLRGGECNGGAQRLAVRQIEFRSSKHKLRSI